MLPFKPYSCLILKMKNPILAALSQKSLSVGIVASTVFFGTTSHALASILIAGAPSTASWLNDVQAKIAGTGLISGSVDVLNVVSSTPTLAQLQAYDAVLFFSDASFADPTTFGNVLADYVDAGGGVVQATFSFWIAGIVIGGRWRAQNYDVWQPGGQISPGNLTLGTIYDPSNPILAGVTSFNGGSSSFYNTVGSLNPTVGPLNPGAVAVADWSNGAPLIAVNTSTFAGKIAGLNFYPPSSDARSDFWVSSTDGALLMANSLNFVTKQVSVPEPNSLLGLFAIGTLGAASTLKRKLKSSQSTEKKPTKVG
jgi:hypothetical protein